MPRLLFSRRSDKLKKTLIFAATIVIAIVFSVFFYVRRDIRIDIAVMTNICSFGDIREAFMNYREAHFRWPVSLEEGGVSWPHFVAKGYLSEKPFVCVAGRNIYHVDRGRIIKVLVCLPEEYRTKPWPFGSRETIILVSDGGIFRANPSDIFELDKEINQPSENINGTVSR